MQDHRGGGGGDEGVRTADQAEEAAGLAVVDRWESGGSRGRAVISGAHGSEAIGH